MREALPVNASHGFGPTEGTTRQTPLLPLLDCRQGISHPQVQCLGSRIGRTFQWYAIHSSATRRHVVQVKHRHHFADPLVKKVSDRIHYPCTT